MRRAALGLALLLVAGSGATAAPKPDGKFRIARLRYSGGGDWYSNRTSLPNLLVQLELRTGMLTARDEDVVTLRDTNVFHYPLVYMNGHGNVQLSRREAEVMRSYLDAGGMLWADDNYGMDASFRRELRKVYPDKELAEVPFDHPIYDQLYRFPSGPPKIHEHDGGPPQGLAIFDQGRITVFYTFDTDIGDGLEDPLVHKDPPQVREAAMKMALNVVLYALGH